MSAQESFTGEISADNVVACAKLAKQHITEEGLANPDSLVFYYPPLIHEGSDARYILEQPIGDHKEHMLYVPVMASHGETTEHFHDEPIIERYKPIAGQLYINDQVLKPEGIAIFSGSLHQATTKNEGALTVIFMENGATKPPEERHIPAIKK